MKSFVLHGNARSVEVTVPKEDYIKVYSYNTLEETHVTYYLAHCDYEKLASFTSVSKLLKFAKANHIFRAYPKTLCPCPPEISEHIPDTDKAEVDGGIFSIVERLKQIREEINQLNGSAFKKSLLTDKQHYQLLEVDMFLADFIARSLPASKGVE